MGSVSVFVMFYFAKVILIPVLIKIRHKFLLTRKFFHHLLRRLCFSDLHAILIESYLEFLIAMYFNWKYPMFTTNGEISGIVFYVIIACGTFIFLPSSFLFMLKKSMKKIRESNFLKVFGGLVSDVRLKNKWTTSYYLIYLIRRNIYVFTAFNFQHFAY